MIDAIRRYMLLGGVLVACVGLSGCFDGMGMSGRVSAFSELAWNAKVKSASSALTWQCQQSLERRKRFLEDLNQNRAALATPPMAVAQDCDGDGKPDF